MDEMEELFGHFGYFIGINNGTVFRGDKIYNSRDCFLRARENLSLNFYYNANFGQCFFLINISGVTSKVRLHEYDLLRVSKKFAKD